MWGVIRGTFGDMASADLTPAKRKQPDPEAGWRGADLDEEERVDDDFIASSVSKSYEPLMPEDEKLFPITEETL